MARSGRKSITIDAPLLRMADGTPVWMDHGEWVMNFFDWLSKKKLNTKLSGIQHLNNKIKLTFTTPKDCTSFALLYANRKK
jgi:hypothetical protein